MNHNELVEWLEAEIKTINEQSSRNFVTTEAGAIQRSNMSARRRALVEVRDKLATPGQNFVISWHNDRNLLDKVLDDVRECLGVDNETVTGSIKTVRFQQGLGEGTSYDATICVGAHEAKWRAGDPFAALYGAALKAVEMALDEARL